MLHGGKAHLRNGKPLVIFLPHKRCTGNELKNIGELFHTKNIFSFLFGQTIRLKAVLHDRAYPIEDTLREALENQQIQPVIRGV